jgi:hypothetical protein
VRRFALGSTLRPRGRPKQAIGFLFPRARAPIARKRPGHLILLTPLSKNRNSELDGTIARQDTSGCPARFLRYAGVRAMEIAFTHALRYTAEREATIREIAGSLIATEDAITRIPKILEVLYPGLTVDATRLKLCSLYQLSPLKEEFNGTLSAKFQAGLEDVIEGLGRMTGLDVLQENKRAVSSLVILVLIVAALYIWHEKDTGNNMPASLLGDYNVFVTIASNNLERDAQVIRDAIDKALTERDKRALARDAADVAAPARGGGAVTIDGLGTLSSGSIAAIPSHEELDIVDDEEFSETRENVDIYIRAADLDHARSGWAGLITVGDQQQRVRMVIVPGIDLEKLKAMADMGPIKGDITVFYKRGRDGEWRAYVMHLYSVHIPDAPGTGARGTSNEKKVSGTN